MPDVKLQPTLSLGFREVLVAVSVRGIDVLGTQISYFNVPLNPKPLLVLQYSNPRAPDP